MYSYLCASLRLTGEHAPLLDLPYPVREQRVEDKVSGDGGRGVRFRLVPAVGPVEVEEHAGDDDGTVAEGEAHVGVEVRLLEF